MARDYGLSEKQMGDPDTVAALAVAWAEEAGLQPDPVAVKEALLCEADPFAEDLVFGLVRALGFRFGNGTNLEPGRDDEA